MNHLKVFKSVTARFQTILHIFSTRNSIQFQMISRYTRILQRKLGSVANFDTSHLAFKFSPEKNSADLLQAFNDSYEHIEDGTNGTSDSFVSNIVEQINRPNATPVSSLYTTRTVKMLFLKDNYVRALLRSEMKKSKLGQVDLLVLEYPGLVNTNEMSDEFKDMIDRSWKAMEQCVADGYAKSLGVRNFSEQMVERILMSCSIKPTIVELNPQTSRLVNICKNNKIEAENGANLSSQIISQSSQKESSLDGNTLTLLSMNQSTMPSMSL